MCGAAFLIINKKLKPFHIDSIEFKTKYYSNKKEEPLLCSYGDTEQIVITEARRGSATAVTDLDATTQVDVIAPQTVAEIKATDAAALLVHKKKSVAKMKSKNNSKRKASDDIGLLDSDEEQLDFSLQNEEK